MQLLNDFCHIISLERTPDDLKCKVGFHKDHFIYASHFPNNPVTPGMCLLHITTEILEIAYDCHLTLHAISSIKFKKALPPDKEPLFIFTKLKKNTTELSTNVSIEDVEVQYVKLSLHYSINN